MRDSFLRVRRSIFFLKDGIPTVLRVPGLNLDFLRFVAHLPNLEADPSGSLLVALATGTSSIFRDCGLSHFLFDDVDRTTEA